MPDDRPSIEPNPPRWQPNPDPMSIHVPGLDTDASYLDQIEQIDQLITIKLQNIDANFSRMHSVLANNILPAVKRFSVGTEPAREAAKLWTSFYEMAAQTRIPTFEEYQSVNETTQEASTSSGDRTGADQTTRQDQSESSSFFPSGVRAEQSGTSSESSFMPTNAQYASTPAAGARSLHYTHQDETEDSSWNATMESPLVRLGREIQSLDADVDSTFRPEGTDRRDESSLLPTPSQRADHDRWKGKERMQEKLTKPGSSKPTEPRDMLRQKYQYESNQSMARTPQRPTFSRPAANLMSRPRDTKEDDSDSDDEGLPDGMSPPRFMSPVLPRRRTGALMQSPAKQAAARITSDLVAGQSKGRGYSDYKYNYPTSVASTASSQLPSMPSFRTHSHNTSTASSVISSAPSLSRHFPPPGQDDDEESMQSDDGGLESMMQRAGMYAHLQDPPPPVFSSSGHASHNSNSYDEDEEDEHTIAPLRRRARSQLGQSTGHREEATDEDLLALMQQVTSNNRDNNISLSAAPSSSSIQHPLPPHRPHMSLEDPDSDSPDDEGYELGPAGAQNMGFPFLPPPTGGDQAGDDSFDSMNSDSLDDEAIPPGALGGGLPPPFNAGAIVEDPLSSDEEDDFRRGGGMMGGREEEDTVFGPRGGGGGGFLMGRLTRDEEDEETRRLNLHRDDFDTMQMQYRVEEYPQESPVVHMRGS